VNNKEIKGAMEKELKEIKNLFSKVFLFALSSWAVLFFGFLFWWIFKETGLIINIKSIGFSLQSLDHMGSAFNIVTALTGVITIWLLSKAVYYQKRELIEIKDQMNKQDETIKEQEKINRTIREIERFISLKRLIDIDKLSYDRVEEFLNSIDWIQTISTNELKNHIDISLIINTIVDQKSYELLNQIAFELEEEIRKLWKDPRIKEELKEYEKNSTIGIIVDISNSSRRYIKSQELIKRIEKCQNFIKIMDNNTKNYK
jgi:tRNA isopentenyl-2-thiomethyl-A-37 hydroxylase MiaE